MVMLNSLYIGPIYEVIKLLFALRQNDLPQGCQLSRIQCEAPFTQRENTDISLRFGLSFTRKPHFYHRKRLFLKTPAKVEISENAGYVLSCELGETAF